MEQLERDIICVGEGNFSFALSLVGRDSAIAGRLIITEFETRQNLERDDEKISYSYAFSSRCKRSSGDFRRKQEVFVYLLQ